MDMDEEFSLEEELKNIKENLTYRECFVCNELYAEDIMCQVKLDMLDKSDIILAVGSVGERVFSTVLEWICPYCAAKKLHDD